MKAVIEIISGRQKMYFSAHQCSYLLQNKLLKIKRSIDNGLYFVSKINRTKFGSNNITVSKKIQDAI